MNLVNRSSRLFRPWSGAGDSPAAGPEPAAPPQRLLVTPVDLTQGDAGQTRRIYNGTFTFGTITRTLPRTSLFTTLPDANATTSAADLFWTKQLHGFQWLRHLTASQAPTARIAGAALVLDWIETCGLPSARTAKSPAWDADVAATRLMSWLRHAETLLARSPLHPLPPQQETAANDTRPDRWFRSLQRHVRFLTSIAPEIPANETRLRVRIALVMAELCMDGRDRTLDKAARGLEQELHRQVASDGGHVSRSPAAQLRILDDLLPLLRLYGDAGKPAPDILSAKATRMAEALRFFRHANGHLARFNGTGTESADHIGRLLRFEGVDSRPVARLASTGFERLAGGRTVVLVDTGTMAVPEAAPDTMAGALSFELSSGNRTIIMNCGWPDITYAGYRDLARATAAHSTLTVADTSSTRLAGGGGGHNLNFAALAKRRNTGAPFKVHHQRNDGQTYKSVVASHNGYHQQFGLTHERHLTLLEGGNSLQGIDRLLPDNPAGHTTIARADTEAAIRFHIPPEMTVSHLSSGHSVLIAATAGKGGSQAWTFTCIDARITLEESIAFNGEKPGDPPRKAMQIVLAFPVPANSATEIRWTFEHKTQPARTPAGNTAKMDGVVGDLLTMLEDVPDQKDGTAPPHTQNKP